MQTFNFLDTELLDILFQGKNKLYGAYTLRKFYPQRIANSLAITTGLILLLFSIYYYNTNPPMGGINPPFIESELPPIVIQDLLLPVPNEGQAGQIKPLPKDSYSPPSDIVENFISPVVTPKPDVIIPPRDIITISSNQGLITNPGMGGTATEGIGPPKTDANVSSTTSTPARKLEPSILKIAEVMPNFLAELML